MSHNGDKGGSVGASAEYEPAETSGFGAFVGLVVCGLLGLMAAFIAGAIVGSMLGALLGDSLEREALGRRKRRKQSK